MIFIDYPSFLALWWYYTVLIYSYSIFATVTSCVAGRVVGGTTAEELLSTIGTTSQVLPVPGLLASEVEAAISHEVLDMTMSVAGLINFSTNFLFPLNKLALHFKSSLEKISWISSAICNSTSVNRATILQEQWASSRNFLWHMAYTTSSHNWQRMGWMDSEGMEMSVHSQLSKFLGKCSSLLQHTREWKTLAQSFSNADKREQLVVDSVN